MKNEYMNDYLRTSKAPKKRPAKRHVCKNGVIPTPKHIQEIGQLIAQYLLGQITPIEFACQIAFVQLPIESQP